MSKEPILYDLVLLLSTSADEEKRSQLVAEVEATIAAAGGSVSRQQDWGQRPTTYRINHQSEAEYHLLQFTGPTSLLETLSHNLRIADTVLRFRVIKVTPGTPEAPDNPPPILVGAASVSSVPEDAA
jgi:small subunit ribosomal protein S6